MSAGKPTRIVLEQVLQGVAESVCLADQRDCSTETPAALLSGSFNPLHHGHLAMKQAGERILNVQVDFELAAQNADKPPLDSSELDRRLNQFASGQRVWITKFARFEQKAIHFGPCWFLVGVDTIVRVADPKFYGGDADQRDQAVAAMVAAECRFLVFGRRRGTDFETLPDLSLPDELRGICEGVAADAFRHDVSSTELRNRQKRLD